MRKHTLVETQRECYHYSQSTRINTTLPIRNYGEGSRNVVQVIFDSFEAHCSK